MSSPRRWVDLTMSLSSVPAWITSSLRMPYTFSCLRSRLLLSVRFAALDAISNFAVSQLFPSLVGNVNCIALFNHEEIGSVSTTGAESSIIPTFLQRLSPTPATLAQSNARSFLISSDMSHAIHPNYTKKHEENHAPKINGGIIIKTNAKQRYASDAIGSFLVKQLIERKGGKVQEYEVRNDMYVTSFLVSFPMQILRNVLGPAGPLLVHIYRKWGSEPLMLVVRCYQCTPFARPLVHMMCKTQLTFSRRSLKGFLS